MGRHLGIDFSRILMDLGGQVDLKLASETEPRGSQMQSNGVQSSQVSHVKSDPVKSSQRSGGGNFWAGRLGGEGFTLP